MAGWFLIETQRRFSHSERVSNSALGRGLGTLLNGAAVVGKPDPSHRATEPAPEARLSPGVESLLLGADPAESVPTKPVPRAAHRPASPSATSFLRRALLLVADLLLVAEAVFLVRKSSGPLSAGETLLCVLAITAAAGLGCLAVWPSPPPE